MGSCKDGGAAPDTSLVGGSWHLRRPRTSTKGDFAPALHFSFRTSPISWGVVYYWQHQRSVLIIRRTHDQPSPVIRADRRPRAGLPRLPCAVQGRAARLDR